MAEKKNKTRAVNIKNKRASFDFLLLDKYTAGIVLTGTEIKSIRAGKASLVDTFCFIHNGEVWVKNMYVAEYAYGCRLRCSLTRTGGPSWISTYAGARRSTTSGRH